MGTENWEAVARTSLFKEASSRMQGGDFEGWFSGHGMKEGAPETFEQFDVDPGPVPADHSSQMSGHGASIEQLALLFHRLTSAPGGPDGSASARRTFRAELNLFRITEDSLAWQVLFVPDGRWRIDYVSRLRSALRAILNAARDLPEPILFVKGSKNRPVHGLPRLERSRLGITAVRNYLGVDSPGAPIQDETELRAVQRWTTRLCNTQLAAETLSEWIATYPDLGAVEDHRGWEWPVWPGTARDWPPDPVLRFSEALVDISALDAMVDPSIRATVLCRRATATMGNFIGTAEHMVRARRYLAHEVLPEWLRGGVPDTRPIAAKLTPVDPGLDDLRWFAAIAMLGFGDAIATAHTAAMQQALLDEALAVAIHGPTGRSSPLSREIAQAIAERKRMNSAEFKKAPSEELPTVVQGCGRHIQAIFRWANITRQSPSPESFELYRVEREKVRSRYPTNEKEMRVVQFADYLIDLARSPAKVHDQLHLDLSQALASFASESTSRLNAYRASLSRSGVNLSAYGASTARNRALTIQKSDSHRAIHILRGELTRLSAWEMSLDKRELAEMDEQLSLLLAGSYIQRVEDALCLPLSELAGVNAERLGDLAESAIDLALKAVGAFKQIHRASSTTDANDVNPELFTQARFEDEFVSEGTWIFRAFDILYRCLAASALLKATREPGQFVRRDLPNELDDCYTAIVTLNTPIPQAEVPRFVQSAITHSFLRKKTLPTLPERNINPVIEGLNFLGQAPRRIGEAPGDLSTGLNVIEAMSGWLRNVGWNAGLIGKIPRDSIAWAVLNNTSGERFADWRSKWDPFEQYIAEASPQKPTVKEIYLGVFGRLKR